MATTSSIQDQALAISKKNIPPLERVRKLTALFFSDGTKIQAETSRIMLMIEMLVTESMLDKGE